HVGKEGEVAEGRALGAETDLFPAKLPALLRHRPGELPAAAALLVRARDELAMRIPFARGRRPHRLRLGPDEATGTVALELAAVAGIDQAVIGPGLRDQSVERHAARTAGKPIVARARGPSSIAAPAARTWSSVTASIRATISPGSNRRP